MYFNTSLRQWKILAVVLFFPWFYGPDDNFHRLWTDEYKNFLERLKVTEKEFERQVWGDPRNSMHEETKLELRLWASYRGQTLARTGIIMSDMWEPVLRYCHYFTENWGKAINFVKVETLLSVKQCTQLDGSQHLSIAKRAQEKMNVSCWCINLESVLVSSSQ